MTNPSFEAVTIGPFFDKKYYLEKYQDIAAAGVDPLTHYCETGWREGRNPNADFDSHFYIVQNPDVAAAKIDPFFHFVVAGKEEGRLPMAVPHQLDAPRAQISTAWERPNQPESELLLGLGTYLNFEEFHEILVMETQGSHLAVAISHDDYGKSVGGVQNILFEECSAYNVRGIAYLHLCPAKFLKRLSETNDLEQFYYAVRVNGRAIGRVTARVIDQALLRFRQRNTEILWITHHLMGHSIEVVKQLVRSSEASEPLFWAHDYFAACRSYSLMRNTVSYCAAPPLNSSACRVCTFGTDRGKHVEQMKSFIEDTSSSVVAPSQAALEIWCAAAKMNPKNKYVAHPAQLFLRKDVRNTSGRRSLRVAFVGAQHYHKGWQVFKTLAHKLAKNSSFRFFHLGEPQGEMPSYIENISVRVTPVNPSLMVDTISRNEIDAVVSWSLWPETFNFAIHEAIAGGAFVIARRFDGHVVRAAQDYSPDALKIVDSEEALHHYFLSGEAASEIRSAPRYRGAMLRSMGSAEIVGIVEMAKESV